MSDDKRTINIKESTLSIIREDANKQGRACVGPLAEAYLLAASRIFNKYGLDALFNPKKRKAK